MNNYKHFRLLAVLILLMTTLFIPAQARVAGAQEDTVSTTVVPTVVQLGPLAEVTTRGDTKLTPFGWGSGTILNSEGYILTNHHVTDVTPLIEKYSDRTDIHVIEGKLAVFITKNADEPPVASYMAEVVVDSEDVDLAVIRITEDLTGKPVDGKSLHLPSIKLGDSDKLKLGQALHVLGYPGIGGDTITSTPGEVSGFTYESGTNGRAWIKTSASISGGNSGGAAVDQSGNLVGIPTQLGSGQRDAPSVDCRPYMDSNNDNKIDDKDVCIPIGGFINALRPVNLARPLIEQALNDLLPEPEPSASPTETPLTTPTEPPTTPAVTPITTPAITPSVVITQTHVPLVTPSSVLTGTRSPDLLTPTVVVTSTQLVPPPEAATPTPTARPRPSAWIDSFIFSAGATDKGQIVTVVNSLPSGSRDLYIFFDYGGFENGKPYKIRQWIDGVEKAQDMPSGAWKWNNSGTLYWGYSDTPLNDGTYKFQVDYEDQPISAASITIGGPDKHQPSITNLTFTAGGTTGHSLPANITRIDAAYDFAGMTSDLSLLARWYTYNTDGTRSIIKESRLSPWTQGASGHAHEYLEVQDPLPAGKYRLDLFVNDQLAGANNVYLSGQAPTSPTPGVTPQPSMGFGPVAFSTDIDSEGNAIRPSTTFPSGISEVYAVFPYQGMRDGANWGDKWYINGQLSVDYTDSWDAGDQGLYHIRLKAKPGYTLAEGEYVIDLFIEGVQVQTATATIGSRSTPTPTPETGVIIKGRIVDAYTAKPVPYAWIGVLREGITWADYEGTDEEFLDMAYTDSKGRFEFTVPVKRGSSYSVGVEAYGYESIYDDYVDIETTLPDVYYVEVQMQPLW